MDALIRRNVAVGSNVTLAHWLQFGAFGALSLVALVTAIGLMLVDEPNWMLSIVLAAGALFMGVCAFNIFKWMQSVRAA